MGIAWNWKYKKSGGVVDTYTKKEIDSFLKELKTDITINTDSVSDLESEVNTLSGDINNLHGEIASLNGQIGTLATNKLDISKYNSDQENVSNFLKELKTDTTNNTNSITDLKNEVALIKDKVVNLYFYKGEVKYFTTLEAKEDFVNTFNLQENVDYKLLDQQVIGVSPTGTPFGSDKILQDNLPNIQGTFQVRYDSIAEWMGANGVFSKSLVGSSDNSSTSITGSSSQYYQVDFNLNPGEQISFTPRIEKPLIAIEFLRRIEKTF